MGSTRKLLGAALALFAALFAMVGAAQSSESAGEPANATPSYQEEQTFRELVWQVRSCMNESARALRIQGFTDRQQLVVFAQNVCGPHLEGYMTKTLGRPPTETKAFVASLAYQEVNRVIGVR